MVHVAPTKLVQSEVCIHIISLTTLDLCFGGLLEAAGQIKPAVNLQAETHILAEPTEAICEVTTIVRKGPCVSVLGDKRYIVTQLTGRKPCIRMQLQLCHSQKVRTLKSRWKSCAPSMKLWRENT
jgi:hypothetical protein